MELKQGKSGFGSGHLALIIAVAGVLMFIGFRQHSGFASLGNTQTALVLPPPTMESAVLADNSHNNNTGTASDAQVLGASAYNKDFVNQFNVDVQILNDNSQAAAQNYAQQISLLYSGDRVYDGNQFHEIKFLNDIKQLAVPSGLADYQKLLTIYCQLDYLKNSGQGSGTQINGTNVGQLLSQVQPELSLARTNFEQTYSINLP